MHPTTQFEIAKMRVEEFDREVDRDRLVRRTHAHPAVDWIRVLARSRARLCGGPRATDVRRADVGT